MIEQRLILPINYFNKLGSEKVRVPLIYLLGPIKNAPNWHDEAIERIRFYSPEIYIACPSVNLREEYKAYIDKIGASSRAEQNEWEDYHRERAQEKGCILFWFPKQIPNKPKEIQDKPGEATDKLKEIQGTSREVINKQYKIYTQSATLQLGRYSILRKKGVKIAVGIEPGFSGERDISNVLMRDDPDIKIFSALEETCKEAAILAGK